MDFAESQDLLDLRQAVRKVTSRYGGDYYTRHAEAGEFTLDLWEDLGRHGFIGINLPEEYGGGGAGLTELAVVTEETAAAGVPLLLLLVASAISGEVIAEYGTAEQQQRWLPGLAAGTSRVVFAITEPDAGSNTHRLATTASKDGSDYVLRGTKHFISGVEVAEAILVVARTGPDELSLFLVDSDAPGLVKHPLPVSLALPEQQFTLFFDDVRVPASALVGAAGQGFRQVFHGLNPERITGAALCVGVGRSALERASSYASQRTVWDAPIGSHQGVSHALAKARIELDLAGLATMRAAWQHDHDLPAGEASNIAKYAAAEAALGAVDAAIQTHGGLGVSTEVGLVPLWGLARLLRIAPVNREMILNYVAQHTLGLPRSY